MSPFFCVFQCFLPIFASQFNCVLLIKQHSETGVLLKHRFGPSLIIV